MLTIFTLFELLLSNLIQFDLHSHIWPRSISREIHYETHKTIAHLLSTYIFFITRLVLCIIFYCQRRSGIHCSGIVFFYLLMETVLGGVTAASYFMEPNIESHEYTHHMIEYTLTVILFLFCCFADRLPPNTVKGKPISMDRVCPKYFASFPSELTFWWITGLILKGYKNPITENDLWYVRKEDGCRRLFKKFQKQLEQQKYHHDNLNKLNYTNGNPFKYKPLENSEQTSSNTNTTELMSILTRTFWFYLVGPGILSIVAEVLQMANPLIIK